MTNEENTDNADLPQWLYINFMEEIRVDGVMILTDQGNMNDGTFVVSIYSGEAIMDINSDPRRFDAKCDGLGVNA